MRWLLILAFACSGGPVSFAAAPRDELLKLVPDDTAICLVVQGLRERSKAVAASPLAEWVGTNFKPALGGAPELQKLKDVETLFTSFLGVSLADLRDEIFGDALVLCYQPGPPGNPQAERGFVMLKARDPAKLAALVNKLNALQKSSGELTSIDEKIHRGQTYFKRSKGDAAGEYYLLADGLFAFAGQEASIQSVIERRLEAKSSAGAVAKSVARLGVENAFLYCWFNPRKLDADVKAHVAAATGEGERATRRQFAQIWSAIDDLAIYLDADKELELGFAAAYRAEAMPPELRTVLGTQPRPSALWQVIPEDAMVALAGRVSGNELIDVALSFAPAEERAAARQEIEKAIGAVVGKDKLPAMLKGVGPDWAAWIAAPKANGWFPTITAAVRIDDADPTVPSSVMKTLSFYSQFVRVQYNREHDDAIESKVERIGTVDATVFSNAKLFPPGCRPAYGFANGHLVFGSSPELIGAFRKPAIESSPTARAPFLRVSGNAFREYLEKHGPALADWISDRQDRPREDVWKEIQNVTEILKAVDRCEVFAQGSGDVVKLAVRAKFVKSLSK